MAEDLNDAVEAGDRPMIMNVFCKMTAILAGIAMLGSLFWPMPRVGLVYVAWHDRRS